MDADERLTQLRQQLDELDTQFVDTLARRFEVTRQVGEAKRDANIAPVDPGREQQIFERLRQRAEERSIDPDLVEALYRAIIGRVRVEHQAIADGRSPLD